MNHGRLGWQWSPAAISRSDRPRRWPPLRGACALAALLCACNLTATPRDIRRYQLLAGQVEPLVSAAAEPGDVILRLGHFEVLGGLVNYSALLAHLSESPFSHVGLVYERVGDTLIVLDIGPYGLQRRFLVDFLIEGPENVVLLRLTPEHQQRLPGVLANARALVESDVLHDFPYGSSDRDFYCSELVDHCYRSADLPLAELVPIRELPNIRRWYQLPLYASLAVLVGARLDAPIALAGNAGLGLYSAPQLRTVLDLVPRARGGALERPRGRDGG